MKLLEIIKTYFIFGMHTSLNKLLVSVDHVILNDPDAKMSILYCCHK